MRANLKGADLGFRGDGCRSPLPPFSQAREKEPAWRLGVTVGMGAFRQGAGRYRNVIGAAAIDGPLMLPGA